MTNYEQETAMLRSALNAILARINGDWDNPDLMKWGALDTGTVNDIRRIARETLTRT